MGNDVPRRYVRPFPRELGMTVRRITVITMIISVGLAILLPNLDSFYYWFADNIEWALSAFMGVSFTMGIFTGIALKNARLRGSFRFAQWIEKKFILNQGGASARVERMVRPEDYL